MSVHGQYGLYGQYGQYGRQRLAMRAVVSVCLGLLLFVGGAQPAAVAGSVEQTAEAAAPSAPEFAGRGGAESERVPAESPAATTVRTAGAARASVPWSVRRATGAPVTAAQTGSSHRGAASSTPVTLPDLAAGRAHHTALRC
ncbi:hypothetical protein H9Y04_17690 [Streptomyces sp. TRM66268-LWL]|uniref:Uncharacterized protein n=1 Tax=Streptomyces polyasparticus TaxID=2767826 RepID=A0ABR7SFY3_9ACTN|nr:hypothetical protein [Streptomyces polyasparticus]MBC9714395.1 hypothetical protein [Streptomyces polyasparticus]